MSKPKDKCRSCHLAKSLAAQVDHAADLKSLLDYFRDQSDSALNGWSAANMARANLLQRAEQLRNERDAERIQNEALHKALAAMQAIENGRRKPLMVWLWEETLVRIRRVK